MTRIPMPCASLVKWLPIWPTPTMPSTLLKSSTPMNLSFSHLPALTDVVACGMRRLMAQIIDIVCSAVVTVFPPGVFMTTMPRRVAAGVSTLSRPDPARPTTFNFSAAAMSSSVTFVPERTMRPSASLISLKSSSFGILDFTTTLKPAFSRSSTPCLERLSLTRIFMSTCLLGHQEFLRLRHTAAELDRMAEPFEHHFSCGDGRNDIEPISVTHVGQPEDLSFQVILSAGRRNPVLHPQIFVDRLSVDAVWRRNSRQGVAGRLFWKQRQARGLHAFPHCPGQLPLAREDLLQPLRLQHFDHFLQSNDQGDGRRKRRLILHLIFAFLLEIEIEGRILRLLSVGPRLVANAHERQAGR